MQCLEPRPVSLEQTIERLRQVLFYFYAIVENHLGRKRAIRQRLHRYLIGRDRLAP